MKAPQRAGILYIIDGRSLITLRSIRALLVMERCSVPVIQGLLTRSAVGGRWGTGWNCLLHLVSTNGNTARQPTMSTYDAFCTIHIVHGSSSTRIHLFCWIRKNPPHNPVRAASLLRPSFRECAWTVPFYCSHSLNLPRAGVLSINRGMTIIIERILKLIIIIIITVMYRVCGYTDKSPMLSIQWTRDTFILIDAIIVTEFPVWVKSCVYFPWLGAHPLSLSFIRLVPLWLSVCMSPPPLSRLFIEAEL